MGRFKQFEGEQAAAIEVVKPEADTDVKSDDLDIQDILPGTPTRGNSDICTEEGCPHDSYEFAPAHRSHNKITVSRSSNGDKSKIQVWTSGNFELKASTIPGKNFWVIWKDDLIWA